jgi:hypothetical protein
MRYAAVRSFSDQSMAKLRTLTSSTLATRRLYENHTGSFTYRPIGDLSSVHGTHFKLISCLHKFSWMWGGAHSRGGTTDLHVAVVGQTDITTIIRNTAQLKHCMAACACGYTRFISKQEMRDLPDEFFKMFYVRDLAGSTTP